MAQRPEDRWFVRWREHGDVDALAQVYDRTASGLLRIALHHVRHPAAAEDLVQTTFVAAIEGARGYDGSRPLMGWLVAILHNQAKWLRRRERRSVDPDRLASSAPEDPLAAATAAEFTAQVDAAIAALPEVYRSVLRLLLKHQLPPAEIAHALERPAGTVRCQIVRGLELLRQAIPAGIATVVLAGLLPARGLAAVRDVVLGKGAAVAAAQAAAASAAAVAAKGVMLGAGMAMKKILIGAVAVVLLCVGTALVRSREVASPTSPTDAAAASATPAGGAAGAVDPGTRRGGEVSRALVASEPPQWRLLGRVRGAAAGEPAARVRVEAVFAECSETLPVGEADAAANGTFAFDLGALRQLPPIDLERVGTRVTVYADDRMPQAADVPLPHRNVARPLLVEHEVELAAPTTVLRGRVVDPSGHPVAEAQVAQQLPGGGEAGCVTDRDGRFWLLPKVAARVRLTASHVQIGSAEWDGPVTVGHGMDVPDLVLRTRGALRARIVFDSGAPVVGLDVYAHDAASDGSYGMGAGTTDREGRIAVHGLPAGSYRLRPHCLSEMTPEWPVLSQDQPETTLVAAGQHLLRFQFEDAQGRPLRPMMVGTLFFAAADREAVAAFAAGAAMPEAMRRAAGNLDGMLVPREVWCFVRASLGDFHGEELGQALPPDDVLQLSVTLRRRERSARLRLVLKASDGGGVSEFEARLEQLHYREPAVPLDGAGGGQPAEWSCYPGRFELEVRPRWGGREFGWFAPFTRLVTLREGELTTVEQAIEVGGRVRLCFQAPPGAALQHIAGLHVEAEAAKSQFRGWQETFIRRRGDGWSQLPYAPANEPLLWPPILPPGTQTLTIRSQDFADETVPVRIRPREVTDVVVQLRAR